MREERFLALGQCPFIKWVWRLWYGIFPLASLGYLSGCAPSQLLPTCLIAEYEKLERSPWFHRNNWKHQCCQHSSLTKSKTQQLLIGKLTLSQAESRTPRYNICQGFLSSIYILSIFTSVEQYLQWHTCGKHYAHGWLLAIEICPRNQQQFCVYRFFYVSHCTVCLHDATSKKINTLGAVHYCSKYLSDNLSDN